MYLATPSWKRPLTTLEISLRKRPTTLNHGIRQDRHHHSRGWVFMNNELSNDPLLSQEIALMRTEFTSWVKRPHRHSMPTTRMAICNYCRRKPTIYVNNNWRGQKHDPYSSTYNSRWRYPKIIGMLINKMW